MLGLFPFRKQGIVKGVWLMQDGDELIKEDLEMQLITLTF